MKSGCWDLEITTSLLLSFLSVRLGKEIIGLSTVVLEEIVIICKSS